MAYISFKLSDISAVLKAMASESFKQRLSLCRSDRSPIELLKRIACHHKKTEWPQHASYFSVYMVGCKRKQESCAIAKMTAQCALYMVS